MTQPGVKALRLLVCVFTLTTAVACGNPCRDLADRVCSCFPDDGRRAICNQRAKDTESSVTVSQQDLAFCQSRLDSHACDCRNLATAEGKAACGLTYP